MLKKIVSGTVLTLLLLGIVTVAFNIQSANAFETIWTIGIYSDGSINPPDAPISTVDNITYTFTEDITYTAYDTAIVIGRDDIILDGNGYVLQGLGVGGHGIDLYYRSNVTIRNMKVEKFNYGIYLSGSSNNSIVECNITENVNGAGISIYESPNNRIVKCNLTNNGFAISLSSSSNNMLKNNSMTDNYYSIGVWGDELSHFVQDVDESNTVNGKPTCYWIDRRDMKAPRDVGYVALINSTNVTVEGLELKNNGEGILLAYTTNSKITNNNLTDNKYGIRLVSSSFNIISRNNMSGNGDNGIYMGSSLNNVIFLNRITYNGGGFGLWTGTGVRLSSSHNNTIFGNAITNNEGGGVDLESSKYNNIYRNEIITNRYGGIGLGLGSDNNMVYENDIISNYYGVWVYSKNNVFCHNNFVDNDQQVSSFNLTNVWDDGYPSGGNYWSDYTGVDSNGDGIGDESYTIDANNTDRYPLVGSTNVFDAGIWDGTAYNVDAVSNSTVSEFTFNPSEGALLRFNVTGEEGTEGFCRVTIPKSLLWVEDGWTILVGDQPITDYRIIPDENYTYLYLTYNHSTKTVQIQGTHAVPEFQIFLILPLLMIATLLAAIFRKRKRNVQGYNHLRGTPS